MCILLRSHWINCVVFIIDIRLTLTLISPIKKFVKVRGRVTALAVRKYSPYRLLRFTALARRHSIASLYNNDKGK